MKGEFRPDFVIIPYPVYSDVELEGLDRVVYGICYWFEQMKDGKCTASNGTLAKIAGTNMRSVSNSLNRLEERGYIVRLYKDEAKRNRTEIITKISFRQATKPSAAWMKRDSSLDERHDSSLDEQSINTKGSNRNNTKASARSAEDEKAIGEVIFAFQAVNPTYKNLFNRKPQREAAWRLLEQFGKEKLIGMIGYLPHSNANRYAPTITTPAQLEMKMGELKAWADKQRSAAGKGIVNAVPTT